MLAIQQSRTAITAFATVLMFALSTPVVVTAEEQPLAMAPAAPSWEEASGYASVETSRAESAAYPALMAGTTWEASSGYRSVEASRLLAAQHALASGDLGGLQEDALAMVMATNASWSVTSSYASVELSRAAASGLIDSVSDR